MAAYLAALERLRGAHGLHHHLPRARPRSWDGHAQAATNTSSTASSASAALMQALDDGRRSSGELLDAAWSDVPEQLRPAAAVTLAAHLDKLEEEGRCRPGVERPDLEQLRLGSVAW